MTLARPEMLAWLWLLPFAMLLLWGGERRRRRRLALVAGMRGSNPGVQLRPTRTWFKGAMMVGALALLIVAMAQPRWGFAWTDVKRHGTDIIVAVDVSTSMLAQDVNPSRIERAKHEILDLLTMLKGDRIGLVAFAGDAFVECPLTEDYAAMRMFVNYLAPDLIPLQGTDLGGAINTSVKALFDGSPDGTEGRAIILLTDGEDQEPDAEKAALEAKAKGVKIYAIGIGTPEGAPIPETGGGFKKDAAGNMVITKPNETALSQLALSTGGLYVRSVAGGADLEQIYHGGIREQVSQRDYQSTRQKLWFERFQWFLGLALLLLVAEFCLRDIRLAALLVAGVAMPLAVPKALAASLSETYNQAVQQYQKGDFAGAANGFAAAGEDTDQTLAERSLFNLGNTQVRLNKLEDAIKAYENALALDPRDQDARDNLEYVKKLTEQQQQQQKQSKTDHNQDSTDKKDQQPPADPSSAPNQSQKSPKEPQKDQHSQSNSASPQSSPGQQNQKNQPQQSQSPQNQPQPSQPPSQPSQPQGGQDQTDKKADQSPTPAKDRDQNRSADAKPQPKPEAQANPGRQEGEGGQDPKDQNGAQQQAPAENVEAQVAPMSPEDAEKVLRAVDDNPKKYLYAPKANTPPRHNDKDW